MVVLPLCHDMNGLQKSKKLKYKNGQMYRPFYKIGDLTLATTALAKTATPTITATRYWATTKHLLFGSFSAPTGFSWNGSHVSLRQKHQHLRVKDFTEQKKKGHFLMLFVLINHITE